VHTQFTDLRLLARCVAWMAQEPRCANQGFNVVNGDYPRWSDLWPQFARRFRSHHRITAQSQNGRIT
jgi:hypothetical protein